MPNYTIGTESGSVTVGNTGDYPYQYEYTAPYYDIPQQPIEIATPIVYPTPYMGSYQESNINNNKKGGDENMRYLYEVILVNPKNNEFTVDYNIAKSETSALMTVYNDSDFKDIVKFDDLKTSCRVLMEYKEEKSLKKAIETIKEAVE